MNVINTAAAPAAIGPYSQGYEVNGLAFTSGQLPVDPVTGEMPQDIAGQAWQSCENVAASLPDLKAYLALRDSETMYQPVKAGGGIGIPCFILEDGTKTMDLKAVLK